MRGKFGEHQTVRSILKSLPRTVHDDVTRAGIGDDYARLLLRDGGSGDTGAAKSVNVAAGVCCDSGYMGLRLDIARLYNSIRIGGYMPWAAVDTIVMPDDDERRMKKLLRKLAGICVEYRVDIITGHTEVNNAVSEPVISVTMMGRHAGQGEDMQELQNQAESMIANQVKKVLLGTKQYNDAAVTSHLSMDFSDYEETVKEYYANSDRTEGMLSHEETYESENTNDGGGVPGTTSNGESGNTTYVSPDSNNSSSSTSETSRDYLPNESITNTITPAGGINYTNSSISIAAITYREVHYEDVKRQGLLDGTTWDEYKSQNSADKKIDVDQDMYSLVANATGISEDKITIIAYESPIFYDKESKPVSVQNILSIVMLVLILGLLAFVVLHSMRTRQAVQQEEEVSVENILQSTPESELEDIDVESKSETRKMIEKFVDENPESAAALLRNWLNEDWN